MKTNWIRMGMVVLGGLDWILCLGQCFVALITQFGLISYLLLGGLYFLCGASLIGAIKIFRKIYLYVVIPVSAVAVWNVTAMNGQNVPAYFHTPPSAQLTLTIIGVLIPMILNTAYLLLPKVKEQFQNAKQ